MKFGVIIPDLSASQQAFYLINYANQAVMRDGHDVTVFFQSPRQPCISVGFGIMHMHEAYAFDGPLIAPNLNIANRVAKFPGTREKYFYVWDLEWLRAQRKTFHSLASVYRNPVHKLIARSKEHSRVIEDCWNIPVVGTTDNFDLIQIVEIINEQRAKAEQGISTA
jgi:hypothetical protein